MDQPQKQFVHIFTSSNENDSFGIGEVDGNKNATAWDHTHLIEGQLSVDVYNTKKHIIVIAPMAGADTSAISVTLHDDVLTIRGVREMPLDIQELNQSTHRECFWGPFSRTVVLPDAVLSHKVQAEYTNGVLIVELTKAHIESKIPVHIVDE